MRKLSLCVIPAISVALAGCNAENTANDAASADAASPQNAAGDTAAPSTANLINGGKPLTMDTQVAHPSGMVVQVNSLQAKPAETVLNVTFINGDDDEQFLNQFPNNRNGYIVTGDGQKFYLSPQPTNAKIAVQPGQTLNGDLVFTGRLPLDQSAVLVLNDGTDTQNQYTRSPGFRIDLPASPASGTPQ